MFNNISILVDNNSWILPYAEKLISELEARKISAKLCRQQAEIPPGDICFLLGCTQIVDNDILNRNKHNLVVHESALPQGKGFAPMAWQIIEGRDKIPVCLIEANSEVDSGDIWLQDEIILDGSELSGQWRALQGDITIKLALEFIDQYPQLSPQKQADIHTTKESFYPRRTTQDSELNLEQPLKALMPLLRTVDNQNYPAFFYYNGTKYRLEIYKDD